MMRGQFRGRRGGFRGRFRGRGGYRGAPYGYPGGNVQQMKREHQRAEKSLVVKGFPVDTNVADLSEFFGKFGVVENVMLNMDQSKGVHALVVFDCKETAEKVKSEPVIAMNDCKLVVEEKKSRLENRKLNAEMVRHPDLTVYVKGLPRETPDTNIKEFFSQHGTVMGILLRFDKNRDHFHYVQFEKKEEAEAVIAMDALDYHGVTLTTDAKKTREEVTEARKVEASHSIYVQGFAEETTEDEIKTLFQKAGTIERVNMIAGKKGAYAFVEFNTPEAVDAAIELENLSIGDSLLIVKKRDHAKRQFPSQLYGPRKPVIDHLDILKKLLNTNTVEEQMRALQTELELTEEDLGERQQIITQLQEVFSDYFPGCKVEPFGSSVNGFGVKGSDLDAFLDLNLDAPPPKKLVGYPKKPVPYIADIPTMQVEAGMLTRESLQASSMPDRARLINRILNASGDHIFSGFLLIKNTRCPIIRMIHTASDIRLDLSINNRLALNNTRLIRMYADYDPRIKPLYYTLRHWAKYKSIAGNPMMGPRLTNYALSMMVFHYLSVCDPPVLPTVEQLASLANKKTIIDDWDCTLVTDKSKTPFLINKQPLVDLMAGFFQYFASFDFASKVLKSRSSQLADKAALQAEVDAQVEAAKEAGEEIEKHKLTRVNSICILDPFVTTHNISANVNNRFRFRVKYEFEQALAKMQHERFIKPSNIPEGSTPVDWGLTFLFARDRLRIQTLDDAQQLNEMGINLFHVAPYHLPISMKISQLPQNLLQPGPDREAFKDTWTSEILLFIQRILMELMLVECSDASQVLNQQIEMFDKEEAAGAMGGGLNENGKRESGDQMAMETEVESKRLKLETVDPHSIILALKCSTKNRMWQNRKQLKKDTRVQMPEADEFALENAVTQKLMKIHPANLDSVLEFYLTFSKEQTGGFNIIRMSMYPVIGSKEFTCFFAFLSSFVAKIVDKCFILKG